MATLHPYLTFNGNCKEAMQFYKEILGGELTIQLAGESPVASQMPAAYHQQVLHASVKNKELEIMATDMVPGTFTEGNTVQMALICNSKEEIHALFEKLAAGAQKTQPLHQMFFGLIGTVTDKFGKCWLLECNNQ